MGKVKIRHYIIRRNNRAYWMPTPKMKRAGFSCQSLGPSGPEAWAKAEELNAKWDEVRGSIKPAAPEKIALAARVYPAGSIGEAMQRYRSTHEWAAKAPRTREDWERGWKYIEPVFARHAPASVTLEVISEWRLAVEQSKSLREAHRAMKIWRALWRVSAAMGYCISGADPSSAVRNKEAKGRSAIYSQREVATLIKTAIRAGFHGYACIAAVMWDGALSPVDGRMITAAQMRKDRHGTWFEYQRGKTGRKGVIALSKPAEKLISWYLMKNYHGLDIAPGTALFRTRRGAAYTKNSLAEDHRDIRVLAFGPMESRVLLDIRRSASTEAVAGGVEETHLSAMMANSIGQSKALEATYAPIQVQTVREAQKARRLGRAAMRENK
jgi:hypothetical protein